MTYDSATTWASTLWVCGSHFRLPPWQPPMACGGVPTLLYGVGEEKKMCGLCGHASLALSFACSSLALSFACSSFLTTRPLYAQHLTTLVFFCFQNATPFPMLNILCYSVTYLVFLYPSSEVTISNMLPWSQPPSLEEFSTSEPIITSLFRMTLYEFGMKNIPARQTGLLLTLWYLRVSQTIHGEGPDLWIPKPLGINMFLKCD